MRRGKLHRDQPVTVVPQRRSQITRPKIAGQLDLQFVRCRSGKRQDIQSCAKPIVNHHLADHAKTEVEDKR